jgi:hypothetical protein
MATNPTNVNPAVSPAPAPEPVFDPQKALEVMRKKIPAFPSCPACKRPHLSLADTLLEVRPFHGGMFFAGGPVYPHAAVICTFCGHTMFFNAVILGLLPGGP